MLPLDQLRQMTAKQRQEYFVNELCRLLQLGRHEISLDGPGKHIYLQCHDNANYQNDYDNHHTYITIMFYDYGQRVRYFPLLSIDNRWNLYERTIIIERNYEDCKTFIDRAIRYVRNAARVDQLEAELAFCKANTAKQVLPLPITDAIIPHLLA